MKTYLVKLMFNVVEDNGHIEFDEQIRVVQSLSAEAALLKARALGRKEEETIVDARQQHLSWKFIDVAEIYPLDEVGDGQQVYSNSVKVNDADSFISYIRRKSMELQARHLSFA